MAHRIAAEGHRVLVVAPFGRDADSVAELLRARGYDAQPCTGLVAAGRQIDEHMGVVLMTEEAARDGLGLLGAAFAAQPPWSDVPLILLGGRRGDGGRATEQLRARLPEGITNVTLLERPLGSESLVSAVASAMRARQRQFDMRDRLAELRSGAAALADSERRLDAIVNSIDQMIWSTRPDGHHDYFNQRWYDYTGVPHGSTDGQAWLDIFHPDDQDRIAGIWQECLATGAPYRIEYRLRDRSGAYRWVLGRANPVRNPDGRIVRWYGTCTDIEDIVQARDVLARSREQLEAMVADRTAQLENASAALRQSQKMEAVGQLTGGIAHDFNNMLTGVIGGLEIIRRRIKARQFDGLERFMDAAGQSAQRAAGLTARLLAFSRRQSLDPRPLDVAELLAGLRDLLRRTVPEGVTLDIRPGAEVPRAVADANQLENAILNLAINARDAMPDGGHLVIETRLATLDRATVAAWPGLEPGRYVAILVTDTGVGMPPEIMEKAFEPFYTTKPIGQGTGLGLSMVYGFARQSGGGVRIHSVPGRGTTVTIHLPVATADLAEAVAEPPPAVAPGNGETVLVVEDDSSVRLLIGEALRELGYAVLEAADPFVAMDLLRSERPIELMVSDVGLPGVNGRELAELARKSRPELPILFVTGYAENAAIRAEFLGHNMSMITKPFAVDELASKVDEMLRPMAA